MATTTLAEFKRDLVYALNSLVLFRGTRPTGAMVLLEGPDDVRAWQKVAPPDCFPLHLEGKGAVIQAFTQFPHLRQRAVSSLDGVIGLVDRDYDPHSADQERLPTRVGWLSPDLCDLEALVLFHSSKAVLEEFCNRAHQQESEWLRLDSDGHGLDRLATQVAAPVGALRAAAVRARVTAQIDPPSRRVVDAVFGCVRQNRTLTPALLVDQIAATISQRDRAAVEHEIAGLLPLKDPWALARGKDLVRAIAVALAHEPKVSLYDREPIASLEHRIRNIVVANFNLSVALQGGLDRTVNRISRGDCGSFHYLRNA